MTYQEMSTVLSLAGVAIYLGLGAIALRRARLGHRDTRMESVADHARRIEGPFATVLLIVAVGLLFSALNLNSPDYADRVKYVFGFIRGIMVAGGLWVLLAQWQVRETWR